MFQKGTWSFGISELVILDLDKMDLWKQFNLS